MGLKKTVSLVVAIIMFSSITVPTFAATKATKQELMEQLNQARKDFISQRDELHDQNRILRINWHKEREMLYKQLQDMPNDPATEEKLNQGAKDFLANKKNVYEQLEILRKDWLKTRAELGEMIKQADS